MRRQVLLAVLVLLAGCQSSTPAPYEPGGTPLSQGEAGERGQGAAAPPVLTGRVRDPHGGPVAGVRLELQSGIGTLANCGESVTDAQGRFRFEIGRAAVTHDGEQANAALWLTLRHERLVSADGENKWYLPVPLVPGGVTVKDFTLIEGGAVEAVLLHSETGEPIEESLRIFTGDQNAMHFFRYADTDEHGRFVERGLFPGVYTIDVNGVHDGVDIRYPILGTVRVEAGKTTRIALRWDRAGRRD